MAMDMDADDHAFAAAAGVAVEINGNVVTVYSPNRTMKVEANLTGDEDDLSPIIAAAVHMLKDMALQKV